METVRDMSNGMGSYMDTGAATATATATAKATVIAGLQAAGLGSGRRVVSTLFALMLALLPVFVPVAQGQSLIQDEQGWVYVNERGEAVLRPFIYDNGPDYFEEGLARFVAKGKMGFHDQSLKIWIPARYDFAFPFVDGKAKVGMDCKFIPHGEHRSVRCQHWENISNPLTAPKNQPEN
ncbi:WG repeat-containing protein [Alcaligenes faecalis]|uniref:WG repeat-containing protein n=1 Tax=Alcaligenes faecalis TaxID=511 RepID=UPI001EF04663|nr:WG repeat-containing protein [Alcaligenes faecalis]ULH08633.1 WG repeat-containing protein [Alcaligenes faecalis]